MNLDQFAVIPVDKTSVLIQHEGQPAGHTRAKVDAGGTQYRHQPTGHVFAAVITRSLYHSVGTGVTNGKAFAGDSRRKQAPAGRPVKAGIANDTRETTLKAATFWRRHHQLAARHALANIVVTVALEVHMQAARIPDAKTLARGAGEVHDNRVGLHAIVAMSLGYFSR